MDHGLSCHQTRIESPRRNLCPPWLLSITLTVSHNLSMKGHERENDGSGADEIHLLRARILEVLRQEPYMGQKIPVR